MYCAGKGRKDMKKILFFISIGFFFQIAVASRSSGKSSSLYRRSASLVQPKVFPVNVPIAETQEPEFPGLTDWQIKNLTMQEYNILNHALINGDNQGYAEFLKKVLDRMDTLFKESEEIDAFVVRPEEEHAILSLKQSKKITQDKAELFKGFVESDGIEKFMSLYLLGTPEGFLITDPGKGFFSKDNLKYILIIMNRGMALLRTAQPSSLVEPSFWQAQKVNWANMKQYAQEYMPVIKPSKIIFRGKERLRKYYRAKRLIDLAEAMLSFVTRIEKELIDGNQNISKKSFSGSLETAKLAFKALSDYAKDEKGKNIEFSLDTDFAQISQRGVIILDAVAKKITDSELRE